MLLMMMRMRMMRMRMIMRGCKQAHIIEQDSPTVNTWAYRTCCASGTQASVWEKQLNFTGK